MSNKPNRKLPDARFTFSPPPLSHLTDRREKYGARYGSTGDITAGARAVNNKGADQTAQTQASCGWLGQAMVLGSFQSRGILLLWHMVGQGPAVLAAGTGWGLWRYSRIYGDKINWNRNNPVSPDKEAAMDSSSNEDNDTQPVPSDNFEQDDVPRTNEVTENEGGQNRDVTDGGGSQQREILSCPSTNRPQVEEDEVPECFTNTRKFSRVISPTEAKIKKKRRLSGTAGPEVPKMLRTERRPTAIAEQEEDFFEQLFESSLEFISDESAEHERDTSDMGTHDGDHDDAMFEELYERSRQMIQSGNDTRRKSRDDDNTTSESYAYRHQDNTSVFEAEGAAEGTSHDSGYGILHRHPSPSKRQLNVHFNNEVSVETFSDADQEANGTKTLLAHGDGPPNNIPGTTIPLPPPVPPDFVLASSSDITSPQAFQKVVKSGKDYGESPLEYVKGKILKKLGNDSKHPPEVSRRDSLPKSVSPTELLRKKQRTVTDKIIKETLSQKALTAARLEIPSSRSRNMHSPMNPNAVRDKINAMEDLVRDLRLPVGAKHYRQLENREFTYTNDPNGNSKYNSSTFDLEKRNTVADRDEETESDKKSDASDGGYIKDNDQSFKIDLKKLPDGQRYFQDLNAPSGRKISVSQKDKQSDENKENMDYVRGQPESERRESREDANRSPSLGLFTYSTPSKLFQKIEDRERADKNSQGLGSFSYTTPSELFMRREGLRESSSKEQPGYWFFKRDSDTKQFDANTETKTTNAESRAVFGNLINRDVAENMFAHANKASGEKMVTGKEDSSQKDVEIIKKRRKKFMDRCKRKKRLDSIEHWTEDHQSCAETVENILSNSSMSERGSNVTVESDNRDSETSIQSIRESFDKIASATNMVEPITMIDDLLSDFLAVMERKLSQGSVVTLDILRELEFVYDSLVYVARQLLEQVGEAAFQAMKTASSGSIDNPQVTRNYAVWLSLMLESSENFLYGNGSKDTTRKNKRELQIKRRKSESPYFPDDQNSLQTVLCDLGVIKDSLTCLLTDDQTDFSSITDLRTLGARDDIRQNYVKRGIQTQSISDRSVPKQNEPAEETSQYEEDSQVGPDRKRWRDKRKQSIKERVERKKLLDGMEHRILHHSSSVEKMENILKNRNPDSSVSTPESTPTIPGPMTKSGEGKMKSFAETSGSFSETMDPFIVTYVYLCDFLELVEKKKDLGIDMTIDDSRELELIYDTLLVIADKLVSQTEDSDIKAASDELRKQNGVPEQKDSTESVTRALQAQRYACWLINKLGSTANLLLRQSSTDIQDNDQKTASDYQDTGQSDMGSQISLDDVVIDLKTIHDSMTSLIYGNESDFSVITNDSYEDMEDRRDSQLKFTPRLKEISNDSLVSGYLADTNSQESVTGQLYPRDFLLLQNYEKLKTDTNGVEETQYCGTGDSRQTVRIHDAIVPERRLRHNSLQSSNSGNIQMPQREWSPREHRHFSSTDSSSRDNSDKYTQDSQVSSRKSSTGEWFYSPTGELMFGGINYPSPSISLSNELSLSTLGTLNESDWALIEQEAAEDLNGKKKEEIDAAAVDQRRQSIYSTVSPGYYANIHRNVRESVPSQYIDQTTRRDSQFVEQTIRRAGIPSQFRPRSQSLSPTAPRFISPDKPVFSKDANQDEFKDRIASKTEEFCPDYQEAENKFGRRLSLPVNQDTRKLTTPLYRRNRTGSLLPQASVAVQHINELSPGETIYEEKNLKMLPEGSEEDILPDRYIPQDMVQVQVRDRLMSTPGRDRFMSTPGTDRLMSTPGTDRLMSTPGTDRLMSTPGKDRLMSTPGRESTDTLIIHDNASRERILSAVRDVLRDAQDSELTDVTKDEKPIPREIVVSQVRDRLNSIKPRASKNITEISFEENVPSQMRDRLDSMSATPFMDIMTGDQGISMEGDSTRCRKRLQTVPPGGTSHWIEECKERHRTFPARAAIENVPGDDYFIETSTFRDTAGYQNFPEPVDLVSDAHQILKEMHNQGIYRRSIIPARGIIDVTSETDRRSSAPHSGSIDMTSETDRRSSIPARGSIDMTSETDRRSSIPARGSIDMTSETDRRSRIPARGSIDMTSETDRRSSIPARGSTYMISETDRRRSIPARSSIDMASETDRSSLPARGSTYMTSETDRRSSIPARGSLDMTSETDRRSGIPARGSTYMTSETDRRSSIPARGSLDMTSETDQRSSISARGSLDMTSETDRRSSIPARGTLDMTSETDRRSSIPARGSIDMTSETDRRSSIPARGSIDMTSETDRRSSIPARGSTDMTSETDGRSSILARGSTDMTSQTDRSSSIPASGSIGMIDADKFRATFPVERGGNRAVKPFIDYTPDKFANTRERRRSEVAAVDIFREESTDKRLHRAAMDSILDADEIQGEMHSGHDRDRSFRLPTRYAYYDDIRRQKHAFYELYEKEPAIPENLPSEVATETEQGGYTRRKSSITFTSNPAYYETDRYEVEDEGTRGQTEWQSTESPDYYSLHLSDPTTKSDLSYTQESPKEIHWSAHFSFPEDTGSVHVDMGPSKFTVNKMGVENLPEEQEMKISELVQGDSPERGQRLYGSTQALDRRGEAMSKRKQAHPTGRSMTPDSRSFLMERRGEAMSKRKQAHPTGRSMTPDSRSFLMEREVSESQNRKLQMEVTTLQTENKLLKEKYNRATAKISELETQLQDTQEDLNSLQETLNKEMSELSARTRSELDRDKVQTEKRLQGLTKENERLKAEVSSLEKQLGSSHRETDIARQNSEKNRTLEAHKSEIASLKEELHTVKALLEQSESHLRQEEDRHGEVSQQLLQLTELKNALQQQADSGGSGMVTDKQLKSLEKRLKVTEERLHQERADRANNLSSVEEKLLSENARLQASEKEFTRQLHREKDRNKSLEQRLKQVREENEKLRLAMPFDDSVLLSKKENYDIPYSSHSNQRAETLKITDDMNYILSQIERQDGVQSGQEEEMIRVLWNKRELAYKQLRDTELQLKELRLEDNNIVDGLKNLRDTYGQAESKLKQMEEQVEDTRSQMDTLENTYKQQLSQLVQERHDAFARLKTAEDILEAVKTENTLLRQSMSGHEIATDSRHISESSSFEALQVEVASLHSKVTQLTRQNKLLEGELSTVRVQLEARTKALEDVHGELEQAQRQLKGDGAEDRRQEKIEILTAQLNSMQVDLNNSTEKYNHLLAEKINLDVEVKNLKKASEQQKTKLLPRTETIESKALQELQDSLAEKEGRVTSLNFQLEETENHLQRTRQDLYIEQEHTAELEAEVETLQQTVSQRAQMFEALSGTEREQHAQYQLLKETLDSVTQELSHKHAQIISLDVNLSSQKDRVAELERELQDLKQPGTGEPERTEVRSGDRLRVHELEIERASLKQELSKAYSAIQAVEEQFRTLQTESKQLEQEVVKEKTVVLQITAEKGEIEQHLEELAEEHDSLIQEKNQAEEDLIKLENKLQEILQKYEGQARKQHSNFETQYSVLTPEARQMASELDTLRLLLDGKEKEMGMLQDKLSRQLIEIDFLNRKVELVHNDSIANREDVARMISELTLKMKEAVSTREVNQFLAGERTKLQSEKNHVEKELEQERQNSDKRKSEVNEVIRKVETSELQQMSIKKEDKNKMVQIASLEAELRNANQNLMTTQTENGQLKNRLDHLQEDLKNLTAINLTLEKRLEMEQNSLSEEKNMASKWKEDYNTTVHDLEVLRHEQLVLGNKLAAEQQTVEHLKKEVQTRDEEIYNLQEELRNLKLDLDSSKGQLLLTKDTVQKLSQDKGSISQDYEGLCRSLTDKERQLNEVKDRTEEKIEYMKREHMSEKLRLEQDKTTAEKERDIVKQEMDSLNEQLKQKEIQLSTFGKTLSDLETVTRKKNELEGHLRRLEGAAGDHKLLLEGQRKEVMSLSEALAKQQDETTRLQVTNQTLQMDLKSEQDSSSREIHDLKLTLEELKSQIENERHYLNDNLTQTQTQLRATQESLAVASEARDSLQAQKCLADHTLEELQSKLSDESTARRLMEQSLGSMRLELEELRNEKNVSEARLAETKNQLSKNEKQLKSEQERIGKLSARNQELVAITQSSDANVKAKDEQTDLLHKEITKLRQLLDSQKQSLTAKMKKTHLEFKQQLDLVQEDKDKLSGQVQKLSTDLDLCREQIANKNKENLKLQEQIVTLEDRVREGQVKLRQAEDSLKLETENQSHMTNRYHEQDEELKRLRSFLAKKVEESGEADKSMWHEMNRVIQELSRQMTSHLDAKPSDNKSPDTQTIQRYKKQLAEVQGELSTEKSLHQITKTSLQALDEDCNRLRQQLHKLRRREKSPSTDRKYKNRMEAINAIIARSQTQAQALLASGGYLEDMNYNNPHRAPLSPHRGLQSPNRPDSPDNSYASDLSIASLPPMPFSKYTTSTRAAEAK